MGFLDLPTFLAVVAFMVGATIGSFLNVVIYRVPLGLSVNEPRRSFCPSCNYAIPFYHNIPLVSWLMLRGQCKNCSGKIAFRYFFVELFTALLFLWAWFKFGWEYTGKPPGVPLYLELVPIAWIFLAMLVSATFIDFDHQIIPDGITIGGTIVGLVAAFLAPSMATAFMDCVSSGALSGWGGRLKSLGWSAIGAGAGFGILYAVVVLGKLAFGRKKLNMPENEKWSVTQPDEDKEPIFTVGSKKQSWDEIFFVGSECLRMRCANLSVNGETQQDVDLRIWCDRIAVNGEESSLEGIKEIGGKLEGSVDYHREAMGFGDVKFMAMIGAFLGWKGVLFTILAGSLAGTAVGLPAKILGKEDSAFSRIPFGPYLALGATLWLFFGPQIVNWYFSLMSGRVPQ